MRMENDQLLRRVTELQQQSWMLEEKVCFLLEILCLILSVLFYHWLDTSLLCPSVVRLAQPIVHHNVMLSSFFVMLCL